MDRRGQTTLEYLLLAGGVLLLAVIVIYYLNQAARTSGSQVQSTIQSGVSHMTGAATSYISNIS